MIIGTDVEDLNCFACAINKGGGVQSSLHKLMDTTAANRSLSVPWLPFNTRRSVSWL